ncbi:MAG: hypothetical protein KME43_16340 [Myxacorys chilensis ATA2-1-KO14]|nr:hypothetical protein [Myxacorys chilensis ATA2-1-KO14]
MIENDHQYRVTQIQAQKFEKALEQILQTPEQERKTNPLLWQAQISALESQLSDLREEMEEYNKSNIKTKLAQPKHEIITKHEIIVVTLTYSERDRKRKRKRSGQIQSMRIFIKVTADLEKDLEILAAKQNRSVSDLLETMAKDAVDQAKKEGKL